MSEPKYIKYGGVRFTINKSPEEINHFVHDLTSDKKDSLFKVIKELKGQGFIEVDDSDLSTIDDEMLPYLE